MARPKNINVDEARTLFEGGMSLVDIANKLDLPAGTVRRWKSVYKWADDSERSEKCERSEKNAFKALDEADLTDKQKLFCLYYSKSFNATMSYKKAYECSYDAARAHGCELLQNVAVRDEITRLKQLRYSQAFLAPEDIFQKYMDIAFADVTDYLEFGREEVVVMGPFGPIQVKDPATGKKVTLMKTVNSVRFKESTEVDGSILSEVKQGKDGASIKLADRMKALQWLADHLDMATEEQKARIALLKAKSQIGDPGDDEEDGFIDALSGKVDEIWQGE